MFNRGCRDRAGYVTTICCVLSFLKVAKHQDKRDYATCTCNCRFARTVRVALLMPFGAKTARFAIKVM